MIEFEATTREEVDQEVVSNGFLITTITKFFPENIYTLISDLAQHHFRSIISISGGVMGLFDRYGGVAALEQSSQPKAVEACCRNL